MPGIDAGVPAQLQPEPQCFCAFIDAVDEGILVRSAATGAIVDVNRPLSRMFGYTKTELFALDLDHLRAEDTRSAECVPAADATSLQSSEPVRFEWLCRRKDGQTFFCDMSLCAITVCGQDLHVLTMRDITERKRLDEALLQSRERLALATASACISIWDWDITANRLVWDDR